MTHRALNSFLTRLPANAAGLRADVSLAFEVVSRFGDKASLIRRDPLLSTEGQRAKIEEALEAGPRGQLRQLAAKTTAAIESVNNRKANLGPTKPRDESMVGELRRQELRAYLRSLETGERHRVALSGDIDVEEAILFGAGALSGLSPEMHGRVREQHMARTNGPALAALADETHALEEALAAIDTASKFLDRETQNVGAAA